MPAPITATRTALTLQPPSPRDPHTAGAESKAHANTLSWSGSSAGDSCATVTMEAHHGQALEASDPTPGRRARLRHVDRRGRGDLRYRYRLRERVAGDCRHAGGRHDGDVRGRPPRRPRARGRRQVRARRLRRGPPAVRAAAPDVRPAVLPGAGAIPRGVRRCRGGDVTRPRAPATPPPPAQTLTSRPRVDALRPL